MSDSESGDSDVQDFKDLNMIFELGRLEQQQQQEAERVRHRNYIYRERVEAEARLMADYFGPRPKYPDYYFRLWYRMSRKLFLDSLSIDCMHWEWRNCSKAWHGQFGRGDKKYPTILLELFDDLLDGIDPVAPFKCNGVTFKKGYYLADSIYPQWASFVKSFTVASSEKNVLYKRKQEESSRLPATRGFVEKEYKVLDMVGIKDDDYDLGDWHLVEENISSSRRKRVIAESLSEEEIAILKEMFKAMDTDNNGAVTCDELKAGLRKFGTTLKDTEIRDLMDAADVDNSGTIDYGEFDGSGYITVDELQQACADHHMTNFLVEDIIKEVDQDNDERIVYGEFVAMMTKGNAGVGRWTMRNSVNISMRDSPRARDSPGAL
ncbi:calcium-dependent protein kinase 26 [Tanacetum coccineum]